VSKLKKVLLVALLLTLATISVLFLKTSNSSKVAGISDPEGFPLYVIIEVNWDGTGNGDWTVWGPKGSPVVGTGTPLSACTACLEMNYDFEFKGKIVQFDEVYVSTVDGKPQSHKVVLQDVDGDGLYTGSLPAARYNLQEGYIYLDRIDYEAQFVNGEVSTFRYLEYEHKKLLDK
jgi:hypothetical protein